MIILQTQGSMIALLDRFGDAGLVFLVMAIVIYFLYKEYVRERGKKEETMTEFNEYLKTTDKENDKTISEFSKLVEALAEKFVELRAELKDKKNV